MGKQEIPDLRDEAKAAGIEMIPGDFTVELPEGPFDLAYLGNISHGIGETENRTLIRKTANVLAPDGRIAIVDFFRDNNPFAAIFGVNMLVNIENGDTYSMDQYKIWLESAGFSEIRLDKVADRQVITAKKNR